MAKTNSLFWSYALHRYFGILNCNLFIKIINKNIDKKSGRNFCEKKNKINSVKIQKIEILGRFDMTQQYYFLMSLNTMFLNNTFPSAITINKIKYLYLYNHNNSLVENPNCF